MTVDSAKPNRVAGQGQHTGSEPSLLPGAWRAAELKEHWYFAVVLRLLIAQRA